MGSARGSVVTSRPAEGRGSGRRLFRHRCKTNDCQKEIQRLCNAVISLTVVVLPKSGKRGCPSRYRE